MSERQEQARPEKSRHSDNTATISVLSAIEAEGVLYPLTRLLEDAVESGASVGFLHPMVTGEAHAYWKTVLSAIDEGRVVLLILRVGGAVAGSVQLNLETRANGLHRAEISKLMVLRNHRRQGLGRALMIAAQEEARSLGRTTLVLDTRQGDPSEALYQSLGWQRVGVIPRYARSSSGEFDATAFYYKILTPTLTKPA